MRSLFTFRTVGLTLGFVQFSIAFALCPVADAPSFRANIPDPANLAGYLQKTFESKVSRFSVDITDSRRAGFQWYLGHFFRECSTDPRSLTWDSGQFSLTGVESVCNPEGNASLATVAIRSATKDWIGVAFGGGAYMEATLSFDPERTVKAPKGTQWPAFWAMSIEHLAQLPSEQWHGADYGYRHFAEVDIFEYDVWGFAGQLSYGGAFHDWYGKYKETCLPTHYCRVNNAPGGGSQFENFVITAPPGTDFKELHRYGVLWKPATESELGTMEYFFDGQPTQDRVHWRQYRDQSPPPGFSDWTFGIVDKQHLVLFISTGIEQPVLIQDVSVWQRDDCKNIYGQSNATRTHSTGMKR